MTIQVSITVADHEQHPVYVRRVSAQTLQPEAHVTIVNPGDTLSMHVWSTSGLVITESHPDTKG